jgi:prepilin-type N-terminal cleavage/methylation domain-containing protein
MNFKFLKRIDSRSRKIASDHGIADDLRSSAGFTLIEMLVVIAIFGILTAITASNYSKFTNDTILTNMAYEMALSIRQAQIYGVAVSNRQASNFDSQFGINFYMDGLPDTKVYHLFEDVGGNNGEYDGEGTCTTGSDICHQEYTLQRGVVITDLWTQDLGGCNPISDSLNISFNRPNPEPVITGGASLAQIDLESTEGTERYVYVRSNGQIYVDNIAICP